MVVDANILFSAILKPGLTRRVWFNTDIVLFSPKFLLTEFSKYKPYLIDKYIRSDAEFEQLAIKLLSRLKFIDDESLKPYLPAAESLVADEKDQFYLCLALKMNAAIWSNDKALKRQKRVKVYSTDEMATEFGLL
ncbi:MAG: PIN domain-containing protein [Candidatus Micrarchaeota archaeon]